ncbi:F-box/LRR-repeat protein At1g67190-like [Punica granatum]|uniref:F-box/LRR-repeat protein At1g67190-like n=1 Tax=Punica granatum TaxID=22663 RepID=A0A6P8CTH9_PUNGR|nr:F-box/LRR-repeat protein At1g67190-like [Punica granatum]
MIFLRTMGLQSLVIQDFGNHEFSAFGVMSWLLHAKDSLRELHYEVRTNPAMNFVDIISRMQTLEKLHLGQVCIERVNPNHHQFTSLRSLSLCHVKILDVDLSLLLSAICPKLESVELAGFYPSESLVEDSAPRFRMFDATLDKLILEADRIEDFYWGPSSRLRFFKFIGKGSLRGISINNIGMLPMPHIEICDSAENLEIIKFALFGISGQSSTD